MNAQQLGYSKKWLTYGLINEEDLQQQWQEFQKGTNQHTEHYRYAAFLNWLHKKETLTLQEINNYIELAKEEVVTTMGGAAVKELYKSPILTAQQRVYVKGRLPEFGQWTQKLISRETLLKQIHTQEITLELFQKCWAHKVTYRENWLIETLLEKTDNQQILAFIAHANIAKKIRLKALQKLENHGGVK